MYIEIDKIQPTQDFLMERNLARGKYMIRTEITKPIKVIPIRVYNDFEFVNGDVLYRLGCFCPDKEYILINGHHRTYLINEMGLSKINAEETKLDDYFEILWEIESYYENGITHIKDLSDYILSSKESVEFVKNDKTYRDSLDPEFFVENHDGFNLEGSCFLSDEDFLRKYPYLKEYYQL